MLEACSKPGYWEITYFGPGVGELGDIPSPNVPRGTLSPPPLHPPPYVSSLRNDVEVHIEVVSFQFRRTVSQELFVN